MFFGELALLRWLESIRTPWLDTMMEAVTFLGEDTVLIVLVAVLYFAVKKESAYRLCFLTLCSLGLNGIIKNICKVPRPFHAGETTCVRPETATGYSFPSGHTQNFSTWSVALSRIIGKKWLLITAILLSVAVGFSRMYLGAHYPSDVAVGLSLGISIGFFGNALYEKLKNPKKLFLLSFLVMTGIGIVFLVNPDPHFADYFKCVGLMGGLWASALLDDKFGSMTYDVPVYKKLLRITVAIILALVLKKSMGLLSFPENLQLSLIWDMLRHLVLVTLVFGVYPLCILKWKL